MLQVEGKSPDSVMKTHRESQGRQIPSGLELIPEEMENQFSLDVSLPQSFNSTLEWQYTTLLASLLLLQLVGAGIYLLFISFFIC